jgi:NAD(P)-dependent dehydrogenase (short-subunit alcohol dehydrogenase family)
MLLKDKIAIVTGAGQGIGSATATALAEAGATVVTADIDGKLAEAAANAIQAHQRKALALTVDAGDVESIRSMVDRTMATYGRIDILVNNAGVTRRADIMDITEADWDRIHRVNAKGVFFCLQAVARVMIKQRGGRIINIASIAGKGYAGTSNAAYAASKGAVDSFVMNAAKDLGPQGVRICGLRPGMTRTEMLEEIGGAARIQAGIATVSLGRAAEPEEIAEAAVFLASSKASYIHGTTIDVTGGR